MNTHNTQVIKWRNFYKRAKTNPTGSPNLETPDLTVPEDLGETQLMPTHFSAEPVGVLSAHARFFSSNISKQTTSFLGSDKVTSIHK